MAFNRPGDDNQGAIDLLARFRVEKGKSKEALQEIARYKAEFKAFADEVAATDRVLLRQVQSLQKEKVAVAQASKESGGLANAEKRVRSEVEQTTKAIQRRNAAASGGGGSALTALGTDLRALPAIQIPGAGFSTETVANITRSLGRLSQEGGGLPTLAQSLDLVKKKVPEVVNAIGAGPLAMIGALGALALALQFLQSRSTEATEAIQRQIDVAKEFNRQRVAGTTESITGDIETDKENLGQLGADLETARQAYALTIQEVLKNNPASITVGAIQDFLNVDTPLHRTRLDYEAAQAAYDDLLSAIELETGLLDDETVLRNDLTQLQEKYNKQLEQTTPRLAQLNQQQQDLIANFEKQNQQRAEDETLRLGFRNEDRMLEDIKRAQQHEDTLADIAATGQKRIEDLQAGFQERLVELQSSLGDTLSKITTDVQKSVDEENEKFRDDELKRAREYRRDEDKVAERYQKERIRRTEDNAQALFDAELANDTAAFIQAKQRARTEDQRAQEDFESAKQQRRADFDEERQQRQQARDARIADIHAEAAEKTAVAQAEFAKETAALQEKTAEAVATEKAAIDERTEAAIDAYTKQVDEEIAARERADNRAAIQDALAEQRRLAAHNEQLAQIESRRQAENSLLRDIGVQIDALRARLNMSSSGLGLSSNLASSGYSSASGGGLQGGLRLRSFGYGGEIDRPTLALMGERPGYKDVLVSMPNGMNSRQGLSQAGSSGLSLSMNNVNLGSMTRDEFRIEMTQILTEIMEGNAAARYGRLA